MLQLNGKPNIWTVRTWRVPSGAETLLTVPLTVNRLPVAVRRGDPWLPFSGRFRLRPVL